MWQIYALLILGAALASSIITSQAQVYSQNVVGYVNVPETAGGFSLEAPPLDADGSGTNNTLQSLYPNASLNDNVYVFNVNSGQYDVYSYVTKPISHVPTTAWFDPNGNISTLHLNPGQSLFYNSADNKTNTYLGQVLSGTSTNQNIPVANGYNLISSIVPISGRLTTDLGYVPTLNDNVFIYSNGTYLVYSYITKPISHVPTTGWFDPNGNLNEPVIGIAQGFWLNPAATTNWSQTFTNQ